MGKEESCGERRELWGKKRVVGKEESCGERRELWGKKRVVGKEESCGERRELWGKKRVVGKEEICGERRELVGERRELWGKKRVMKVDKMSFLRQEYFLLLCVSATTFSLLIYCRLINKRAYRELLKNLTSIYQTNRRNLVALKLLYGELGMSNFQ